MKILKKLKNMSQLTKDRLFAFLVVSILAGFNKEIIKFSPAEQYYQDMMH